MQVEGVQISDLRALDGYDSQYLTLLQLKCAGAFLRNNEPLDRLKHVSRKPLPAAATKLNLQECFLSPIKPFDGAACFDLIQ